MSEMANANSAWQLSFHSEEISLLVNKVDCITSKCMGYILFYKPCYPLYIMPKKMVYLKMKIMILDLQKMMLIGKKD